MSKTIADYENPTDAIEEFEKALGEFVKTSEKQGIGVVALDHVSHAIELGLRFQPPKMYSTIPERTHINVPLVLKQLGIEYMLTDDKWENMYRIEGSIVYDSSRYLTEKMFELDNPNQKRIVVVSFDSESPLNIGYGAALITNSKLAYEYAKKAAYGGRDSEVPYWEDQKEYGAECYHYGMRPADAIAGLNKLAERDFQDTGFESGNFPNLRNYEIKDKE